MTFLLPKLLATADPILQWLVNYGYIALVALLALGIIGLPIPDETLLALAGAFVSKGKWSLLPAFISAYTGAMVGISVSFLLGRTAGTYLIKKYGYLIGLTDARIQQAHNWFEKIGKWALVIGYFIPGFRHFTGYIAGTLGLRFYEFGIFAYSGALIWSTTFLSIGYFFHHHVLG